MKNSLSLTEETSARLSSLQNVYDFKHFACVNLAQLVERTVVQGSNPSASKHTTTV